MPRPPDPGNRKHQERMQRYRGRLEKGRIPEDTPVDRAVAAAVTAYAAHLRETGAVTDGSKSVLDGIVTAAVGILVARGYDEAASRRIAVRRLSRHQSAKRQRELMRLAGLDSKRQA